VLPNTLKKTTKNLADRAFVMQEGNGKLYLFTLDIRLGGMSQVKSNIFI